MPVTCGCVSARSTVDSRATVAMCKCGGDTIQEDVLGRPWQQRSRKPLASSRGVASVHGASGGSVLASSRKHAPEVSLGEVAGWWGLWCESLRV